MIEWGKSYCSGYNRAFSVWEGCLLELAKVMVFLSTLSLEDAIISNINQDDKSRKFG